MAKLHVKKGDVVTIIAGEFKGRSGKILAVLPAKNRVVVEGCALVKKHQRKNKDNPKGAIIEREGTIHISNVMPQAKYEARQAKRQPAKQEKAME